MNTEIKIPPILEEAVDVLADNLLASEPFLLYTQTRQAYEQDAEARILLRELTQKQNYVSTNQASGNLTQDDLATLRSLQQQVYANPVLVQFFTSQQAAVNFLREINLEISELLGIDFAQLARSSTC
jgi:cell fate (sporulation/competence/biofilm development) regulator YlbF (YheA/YmcA/DUF963 family)